MTRALIINEAVRAEIKQAIERARKKPLPIADLVRTVLPDKTVIKLSDRRPGSERSIASENVLIPHGYRVAISFEEQPAGIVRHLSVSVDDKGKVPNIPAVEMILEEFGFDPMKSGTSRVWLEEFEPGHQAVNIAQLTSPGRKGNA